MVLDLEVINSVVTHTYIVIKMAIINRPQIKSLIYTFGNALVVSGGWRLEQKIIDIVNGNSQRNEMIMENPDHATQRLAGGNNHPRGTL